MSTCVWILDVRRVRQVKAMRFATAAYVTVTKVTNSNLFVVTGDGENDIYMMIKVATSISIDSIAIVVPEY